MSIRGNTLDVVINQNADNIVSIVEVTDPGLSDIIDKVSRDHLAVISSNLLL